MAGVKIKEAPSYGDSHVYKITDKTRGKTHKVGESSGGVRKKDGRSKRAEAQVRKLRKQTDRRFKSEIIRKFDSKKGAYGHENQLMKRYRKVFKGKEGILPGNKTNH